jgi:catechol 2,3-dioxygenase-like lactoylglutathione lyase family enzyme
MTGLLGISHLTLTVRDVERARWFWVEVLGLDVAVARPDLLVVVHRASRIGLSCISPQEGVSGEFDERRIGLDHLSFEVGDRATLGDWVQRLDRHDVPYAPIEESEWGWHLNLRAPDNIPVELIAGRPEILSALFDTSGDIAAGPAP